MLSFITWFLDGKSEGLSRSIPYLDEFRLHWTWRTALEGQKIKEEEKRKKKKEKEERNEKEEEEDTEEVEEVEEEEKERKKKTENEGEDENYLSIFYHLKGYRVKIRLSCC